MTPLMIFELGPVLKRLLRAQFAFVWSLRFMADFMTEKNFQFGEALIADKAVESSIFIAVHPFPM